ncbi:HlyD family secretion protein [Rosenbergiella collisarenosi]|uniref:HlyD family secretion protein n=1 Tax=Rosenbergiella collisarenosi TaxID=1544695 RepID=UPI001F502493|nr:HlyD family secretion protein [Rosenbergiella collisarenosi]
MFREEAVEHKRNGWKGRAILLEGVPTWLVCVLISLLVAVFLAFIFLGNYTRRINVTGEVTTLPRPARIYSPTQGVITQIFKQEGDEVRINDPIMRIDTNTSINKGTVSSFQRAEIESQITTLEQIITKIRLAQQNTYKSLETQKNNYLSAYNESTQILETARQGLKKMSGSYSSYSSYLARGLINKDQMNNMTYLYYQQQNSLLSLETQNQQNKLRVSSIDNEEIIQNSQYENRIYEIEMQKIALNKELIDIDAKSSLLITARSNGVIDQLNFSSGQMVNSNDELVDIVQKAPQGYYLTLWVPNESIPYVKLNDSVNIRYDAFPYQKFGQFRGRIVAISKTPSSLSEMARYRSAPSNNASNKSFYRVMVKPQLNEIAFKHKKLKIGNGMKADVTLFLEERKIYQWILSPYYDMKSSVQGVASE